MKKIIVIAATLSNLLGSAVSAEDTQRTPCVGVAMETPNGYQYIDSVPEADGTGVTVWFQSLEEPSLWIEKRSYYFESGSTCFQRNAEVTNGILIYTST